MSPETGDAPVLPPEQGLCVECRTGIASFEPDVILCHVDGGVLWFHERCAAHAYACVIDDPSVWGLIHRCVDPEAN